MLDRILETLGPQLRDLYAATGRPSVVLEQSLRTLPSQALDSVRRERRLMEQPKCNLMFRWFVGIGMNDPVWNVPVFSKNRNRLLKGQVAELYFPEVVAEEGRHKLLSDGRFTVDRTLVEAWAGIKSHRQPGPDAQPGIGESYLKLPAVSRTNRLGSWSNPFTHRTVADTAGLRN